MTVQYHDIFCRSVTLMSNNDEFIDYSIKNNFHANKNKYGKHIIYGVGCRI